MSPEPSWRGDQVLLQPCLQLWFTLQELLRQSRLKVYAPEEAGEGEIRFRPAIIEKQPWEKIVARFNQPHTFFYLNPPYFTKEHIYEREEADAFDQHEELAEALNQVKGKFLLS